MARIRKASPRIGLGLTAASDRWALKLILELPFK